MPQLHQGCCLIREEALKFGIVHQHLFRGDTDTVPMLDQTNTRHIRLVAESLLSHILQQYDWSLLLEKTALFSAK